MNFPIKSFGWLGHHGHFHEPWKFSWRPFSGLDKNFLEGCFKRCLAATVAAVAVYLLGNGTVAGTETLAALAGVSGLLYLFLLLDYSSPVKAVLVLLAVPAIFSCAYASLTGSGLYLVAAFVLHVLVSALQISGRDQRRNSQLAPWLVYNASLILLLL